jgi:protein-S-isoprenylcysteine O-methyltransferase Ste14
MSRLLGILSGLLTHALFALTVWQLFRFLQGSTRHASGPLWIDLLLAVQFAAVHSMLLLPPVRQRLERWIPSAFYGLFFCMVTCAGLLLVISQWRSSPLVVWQAQGFGRMLVEMAFAASWILLFYSLSLNGLGYQTGWTPWWHWLRRQSEPRRNFRPRSAYLVMRHPVYLSFLGLIWFTPTVTLDRALLIAIWTVYVFVGSYLKDRRLQYYLGSRYREYQAEVPGYPGMIFGPLARVPIDA